MSCVTSSVACPLSWRPSSLSVYDSACVSVYQHSTTLHHHGPSLKALFLSLCLCGALLCVLLRVSDVPERVRVLVEVTGGCADAAGGEQRPQQHHTQPHHTTRHTQTSLGGEVGPARQQQRQQTPHTASSRCCRTRVQGTWQRAGPAAAAYCRSSFAKQQGWSGQQQQQGQEVVE